MVGVVEQVEQVDPVDLVLARQAAHLERLLRVVGQVEQAPLRGQGQATVAAVLVAVAARVVASV